MSPEFILAVWLLLGAVCSFFSVRSFIRDQIRFHGCVRLGDVGLCVLLSLILVVLAPLATVVGVCGLLSEAKFWDKEVYRRPGTDK